MPTINKLFPNIFRCGVYGRWDRDKTDGGAPNNVSPNPMIAVIMFYFSFQYIWTGEREGERSKISGLIHDITLKLHHVLQAKFLTHNTQYLISQTCDEDRVCVISLVQRFRPRNTPHEGFMCIGFTVFRAPENIQYRMTDIKDAPVSIIQP